MKLTHEQAVKKILEYCKTSKKAYVKLMLWDSDKSIQENVGVCGLKFSSAGNSFKNKYDLGSLPYYKHHYKGRDNVKNDIKRIKILRKMKYGFTDIARIYGVTKQRIEQVVR